MTLFNASFEQPDGTAPALVSTSFEPFDLTDGDPIAFHALAPGIDVVEQYVVDSADFADVTAATATELASAMSASMPSFNIFSAGGAVEVRSNYYGADSMIEVASGGGVQAVLLWPQEPAYGLTYPGVPQGWAVTSSSSTFLEWARFDSYSFGLPWEDFEQDWGQDILTFSADGSETFEGGWIIVTVGGALSAAVFDGGATQSEDFENLWDILSPADPLAWTTGAFVGSGTYDGFELNWSYLTVTSTFDIGDFFADVATLPYESFEDVTTATHVLVVSAAPALGTYRVHINGQPYTYVASGVDDELTILTELRTVINANTQMDAATITSLVPYAYLPLSPSTPVAGTYPVVTVESPEGEMTVVLATESTDLNGYWVGQDYNFTL